MFLNTFLEILGVIGIVVVSAFVIIFLFDLFISLIDGSNGIFFRRNKNNTSYENSQRPVLINEPVVKEEKKPETEELKKDEIMEAVKQAVKEIQEENKEDTKVEVKEQPAVVVVEVKEEPKEEVKEEPKEEVKEEPKEEVEEPVVEEKPEEKVEEIEEDEESIIRSITEETKKELARQEQEERLTSENEDMARIIESLKAQIEEDKKAIRELEEKVNNQETVVVTEKVPQGSKEEILARLEVLRQRLKENERELSANKKEFVPLRRVNKTLEKDKKKLRRREALVAKQRTVLFGVNNYMDIDNEKAKELDEELELLEGLKLSVQHCEEVMEKNKERYPILERANAFLVKTRDDLKADIKELEDRLAVIESEEAQDGEDTPSENEQ